MQLISAKELAKRLSVPPPTIYSWVRRGVIPYYQVERCLRFSEEEIENWLNDKKKSPICPQAI